MHHQEAGPGMCASLLLPACQQLATTQPHCRIGRMASSASSSEIKKQCVERSPAYAERLVRFGG